MRERDFYVFSVARERDIINLCGGRVCARAGFHIHHEIAGFQAGFELLCGAPDDVTHTPIENVT